MNTKKMKKNISNLIYFFMFLIRIISGSNSNIREFGVGVGVVVDVDSLKGELGLSYLSIAHDDFYSTYQSYMTKLVFHVRDFNGQIIMSAGASALDLRKQVKLNAIIGPQNSSQGNKAQVPIIYFSVTIPSHLFHSPNQTPSYLIQKSQTDATKIVANVKAFQWLQVCLVFEDTDYGVEIPSSRWKWKFFQNNTSIKQAEANIFGLWAYDTLSVISSFGEFSDSFNSTHPFAFAKFQTGPKLLHVIFAGSYNDLVNEIISLKFDEAVGDTVITANRFRFVSGRYHRCDDKWRFLKPLTRELWLTSIALFILTGAAVHTVGENGRDVIRLEHFSMVTFDPRHDRDILEFDDDRGGGGAAGDQVLEMDTGARQRWWKKVWRLLLKQTTQH